MKKGKYKPRFPRVSFSLQLHSGVFHNYRRTKKGPRRMQMGLSWCGENVKGKYIPWHK